MVSARRSIRSCGPSLCVTSFSKHLKLLELYSIEAIRSLADYSPILQCEIWEIFGAREAPFAWIRWADTSDAGAYSFVVGDIRGREDPERIALIDEKCRKFTFVHV